MIWKTIIGFCNTMGYDRGWEILPVALQNSKRGKHCFEVHTNDRPPYVFAAESDAEMTDWIKVLNKVINAAETASNISIERSKGQYIIQYQSYIEYLYWRNNSRLLCICQLLKIMIELKMQCRKIYRHLYVYCYSHDSKVLWV